jgi:DNA-binding beta-propeller fold protein YncE
MKRSFSLILILFLAVLISTCGVSDGGGESDGASYNPLWVSIDTSSLQNKVATSSVDLQGTAYCGEACPPGDAAFGYCPPINYGIQAPAMDISWSNLNTGIAGVAVHGISGSCSCLFSYCFTSYSHRWIVYGGVPLALGDNVIEVKASDASGNSAKDSVTVTRTTLYNPQDIAVDTINNQLYVVNNDSNYSGITNIVVYGRTDNGYATPKSIIAGTNTGLYSPYGIAADNINNEILVANGYSILFFPLTANGNVTPTRTISGASTGLSGQSLKLDNANNEIFVANSSNSITVYARTAYGDAAPIRTISGASTGLSSPYGIAVDNVNDEIFAANFSTKSITVYARTADGDVTPIRTISGASTGLSYPIGIAIDNVNNEIFVTNYYTTANSITVYARTADGDVAPIRTFSTSDVPKGIDVDNINNEIFVTEGYYSINVYPRTANGNVNPIRTIH